MIWLDLFIKSANEREHVSVQGGKKPRLFGEGQEDRGSNADWGVRVEGGSFRESSAEHPATRRSLSPSLAALKSP